MALLKVSKAMLAASEGNDWSSVTELEQQRVPLLKQFFDEQDFQTVSPDIRAHLEALIAINQAIQCKSEIEKQNILKQLGSLKRINKVVDAYGMCM